MEESKRATTRFGHLSSSTKSKQDTKLHTKKIQHYDRKFVVKQYIKLL